MPNGGVHQDRYFVDQKHNTLILDTGIILINATTNGQIRQNRVTSTRVRKVASTLTTHHMQMLRVEPMWRDAAGGAEA